MDNHHGASPCLRRRQLRVSRAGQRVPGGDAYLATRRPTPATGPYINQPPPTEGGPEFFLRIHAAALLSVARIHVKPLPSSLTHRHVRRRHCGHLLLLHVRLYKLKLLPAGSESPRSKPASASHRSLLRHRTCSRPSPRQRLQVQPCHPCRLPRSWVSNQSELLIDLYEYGWAINLGC